MEKQESVRILSEYILNTDRQTIIDRARRDEEKPFGTVLDDLRNNGIPKTDGYPIAAAILAFFSIDNSNF